MRYHAERGNDQWHARIGGTDAGASAADGDAERLGMHYLAECGNDQWHTRIGGMDAGASAAGWGRGASWDALPRGAWERSVARADRWHGRWRQRGGMGTRSVLRCVTTRNVGTISGSRGSGARTLAPARRDGDAERLGMHYHAERGNDQWHAADRWHGRWRQRGGMGARSVSGRITTRSVGTIRGEAA
jgi:hypothetical protein